MLIVSHRARAEDQQWPDNTLEAVESVWKNHITGVEVDVWVTKDNHIVLSHDPKIKGTNGEIKVISKTSYSELKEIDLGKGAKITLLSEILGTIPQPGKLFIEIKCGEEIVVPLQSVLAKSNVLPGQIAFISFIDSDSHQDKVKQVADQFKDFEVYALFGRNMKQLIQMLSMGDKMVDYILTGVQAVNADGFDVHVDLAKDKLFNKAGNYGLSCHAWDVNSLKRGRQLQSLGVDSVTSDIPLSLESLINND